jgi:hypothetical protein
MPKSTKQKLKYQKEYNAQPEIIKRRVANNAARRKAMAEGRVQKGDGNDVAHKTALANGGGNSAGNLIVEDASKNRGWRKKSSYKVPNK